MHDCCSRGESAAPACGAPAWARRTRSVAEWALPVTALALVPKCPACLAGYVLLATGIGLSVTAAAAVRWTIIGLCGALLGLLLLRLLARMARSA
jgi:hypothetical protein